MNVRTMRRLAPVYLSASLVIGGVVGCSDDASSPGNTVSADGGDAQSSRPNDDGPAAPADTGSAPADSGASDMGMPPMDMGVHDMGMADAMSMDTATDSAAVAPADLDVMSKAADLRVGFNLLLGEHLFFAAKATGAAIDGRAEEFTAYGVLLNQNGNEVGALVGQAFGASAETQFNAIWSAHNGYFVDYTSAVANKDEAKKAEAVKNLTEKYVPDFAKFLAGATGLPEATLTQLTTEHVLTTKAIVDAQGAEDWVATYAAIRAGFAHMKMIGDPLAAAIAGKFPQTFPGHATAKSVDLRVGVNLALQEHLYLATLATGAALGGRATEFQAAGGALNTNGTELADVIGGLYGPQASVTFNGIWSAHNGFFVDYTTGVATKDEAKKSKAVSDLTSTYVPDFAKFLAGATGLPEAALAELATHHVLETKAVVDAQALGKSNAQKSAQADLEGARHMRAIGDPLSAAIVSKLPQKFGS